MKRKIIVTASAAVAVLMILCVILVMPVQPGRQIFLSRPESKIVDAGPVRMQRISFTVTNMRIERQSFKWLPLRPGVRWMDA